VDSSDGWAHVLLHVRRDKQQATLSLDLASSGFDGEDAQALRAVFRCLLEAAGLDEREPFWSDLTG